MKRILIIGNHTCANRGDAAILRGLITGLENHISSNQIDVMSRYIMAGQYILERKMIDDFVFNEKNKFNFLKRVKNRLSYELILLSFIYPISKRFISFFFSDAQRKFCRLIENYESIIQVGGSFFIDLYGIGQFENLLLSLYKNKDIVLVGHSLGPFKSKIFKRYSKKILPKINKIFVRDTESMQILEKEDLISANITLGSDTAWLIETDKNNNVLDCTLQPIFNDNKVVAITLRNLAPFNSKLNISQEDYENIYIEIIEKLIKLKYKIICISMCTGLDRYNNDDRMIGLKIKNKLSEPDEMFVLMNEYTDVEIGNILSHCHLLIGTRLHSVILSLLYNTPALAITYEHKSKGILEKLNIPDYCFTINDMQLEHFEHKVIDILNRQSFHKNKIKNQVNNEIDHAWLMINQFFKL